MYVTLSIIALCAEALILGFFIYKTARHKKAFTKRTTWYAVPVFALSYYLYTVAHVYAGNDVTLLTVLRMVPTALEAFLLKLDLALIADIAAANIWFKIAFSVDALFAAATLVASAIGLWGAKLINDLCVRRAVAGGRELVIGTSETALKYARDNDAIVFNIMGNGNPSVLIEQKYRVMNGYIGRVSGQLKRRFKKSGVYHFIAFADGNFNYGQLVNWFTEQFGDVSGSYFTLHVEASLEEADIINRAFIDTKRCDNLCVKSFNTYELIARKVVSDHPLSAYLPESFYGEHRTIKPGKKINVVFMGFGKVNYELMKLMIMQNRFVSMSGDGKRFTNFQVNYYVFEDNEQKIYTDVLLRLKYGFGWLASPDLPPPEPIGNIAAVEKLNLYSSDFSERLKDVVMDRDAYTFLFVSMGSDYENVSYAENVQNAFPPDAGLKTFVRVKGSNALHGEASGFVCFGYAKEILSRPVLINDGLDNLAQGINGMYIANSVDAIKNYYSRPSIEMESNIYHAVSIFFKAGLLGLKFVGADKAKGLTPIDREELLKMYSGYEGEEDYQKYFKLNTWCMLGFSEHSRWAAHYILKGYRAMAFDEISVERKDGEVKVKGKDAAARKHCCLTDYYGLDKYHRHLLEVYNQNGVSCTIDDVETYKYDYMFITDGYDDMIKNGYVLVKNDNG